MALPVKLSTLSIALCCLSCQPNLTQITSSDALPIPPFSDLTDHRISLGEQETIACSSGTIEETISSIQKLEAGASRGSHHIHLEELSSRLFQQVATSKDPDAVIMTLLATTACHHPLSRMMSYELIRSENPIIQLSAVQALSSLNTAEADDILTEALRSDYPAIRLEAAWKIACKRSPQAFAQIDALSYKLPDPFRSCLPELFAVEGSINSVHRMRQLLNDPDEDVIIEALVAVGRHHITGVGDLMTAMESHSPAVLEALAFGLRSVDSDQARAKLRLLAKNPTPCVRLQAALSLIFFGESYVATIQDLAAKGDLFAVAALGECRDPILPTNLTDSSKAFQTNLALSLLAQKDPGCTNSLKELLALPDDQTLYSSASIGHSLWYWDIAPIESFDEGAWPMLKEQALVAKEALLIHSLDLNEDSFIEIAKTVFEEGRVDLFPCLIQLLENQRSDAVIDLLRQESHRVGAPYNRAFATLCLVRLGIEKDEKSLQTILNFAREQDEQSWRPPLPWFVFTHGDEKQTSQQAAASAELYIGTIDALSMLGTDEAIDTLSAELSKAPKKFLPFVVASLLHATL
jgi:HEAT repeat protein